MRAQAIDVSSFLHPAHLGRVMTSGMRTNQRGSEDCDDTREGGGEEDEEEEEEAEEEEEEEEEEDEEEEEEGGEDKEGDKEVEVNEVPDESVLRMLRGAQMAGRRKKHRRISIDSTTSQEGERERKREKESEIKRWLSPTFESLLDISLIRITLSLDE